MAGSKTIIEIKAGPNEPSVSVIKRFSRKVNESGVLRRARALRFSERPKSDLKKKRRALRRMELRAEREKLLKLGKIKDAVYSKGRD